MGYSHDPGVLGLFLGDGAGGFVEPAMQSLVALGPGYSGVPAPLDFDRDGDLDFVVNICAVDALHLFVNDGSGTFTESSIPLGEPLYYCPYVALADFTADGHRELRRIGDGEATIYSLDGSLPPNVITSSSFDGILWPRDLDADGDADLVYMDEYDGSALLAVAQNRVPSP